MIEVLVPEGRGTSWEDLLSHMTSLRALEPFAPASVEFIGELANAVATDRHMRSMPELVALAHWMRKPHILEIEKQFDSLRGDRVWLPRGVALHFAPSNVDSIFVYSWFLSLLVGNANIVRLSTRRGDQLTHLLSAINRVLAKPEFSMLRERTLVLSYEYDDSVTGVLSGRCQVRVLWGGDRTIDWLRRIPVAPLATELAFADRFSFAILKARAVVEAGEKPFHALVHNFFSDAFWFDQLACSSPRMVVWVGSAQDIEHGKERFWPALKAHINQRGLQYPAALGLTRMCTLYAYAARGAVDSLCNPLELPARAHLSGKEEFREMHCGGGLFLEREFPALRDVIATTEAKDQTVSVYGFGRAELEEFARALPNRAVDRIVAIGKALQFSQVWDGINLLQAFSREVQIDTSS